MKQPNQDDTQYLLSNQMFLGIQYDLRTFLFYESDASNTFMTFEQKDVDFEIFHSKTMIFKVIGHNDFYHLRVVFSADMNTMDTVFACLSGGTAQGSLVNALKPYFQNTVSTIR